MKTKKILEDKLMKQTSQNIFLLCPDCLISRTKLKNALSDLFYDDKLSINIILSAYDMGIVSKISSQKIIDSYFFQKCQKELICEYGLTESNARNSLQFWIKNYAAGLLNISIDVNDLNLETPKSENNSIPQFPSDSTNVLGSEYTFPNTLVDVSKLKRNDKFPKSLFRIDLFGGSEFTVENFNACVRKKYDTDEDYDTSFLSVLGEFTGSKGAKSTIMMAVVIHNDKGYPISVDARSFATRDFSKKCHFDIELTIPSYELISDVTFTFSYAPDFL